MRNINGCGNDLEVSDICYLSRFHKVRYKRETEKSVYISLFIYPRGTDGTKRG